MSLKLRDLQEEFQAYILQQESKIASAISPANADPDERIQIYRRGYFLRLEEVLEKDMPIFRKYIGDEQFAKIAQRYIEHYPSNHFNICNFSRHFSKFLAADEYKPEWSEMAAFEWALSCAVDEPDGPHLELAALGTLSGEDWPLIQFSVHPSLKIHQYFYNIPQIYNAILQESDNVPELTHQEPAKHWLVWRFNLIPYFESIQPEQYWMINAIADGKTFTEICEGLCQFLPEEQVAEYAAGSLRNWIEKGIFSSFAIASRDNNT